MYSHLIPLQGDVIKPGELVLSHLNLLGANTYYEGVLFSSGDLVDSLSKFQIYFGMSFHQTETHIYIKKANLTGLTPSINNTAESLFIALLNKVISLGTIPENRISAFFWRSNSAERKIQYVILLFFSIDTSSGVIENFSNSNSPMEI